MRISVAFGLVVVMSAAPIAYGQESLVGRYKGDFIVTSTFPGRPDRAIDAELIIKSVENGVVKGTGKSSSPSCHGVEHPIEGKQEGNKLQVRAADSAGKCTMEWSLTVEGSKLVGTTRSGYRLQLSKQ
jgi:hypothetical protein